MEINFEGREMWKWNISTEWTQRVDEKNGVICLVIMFVPRVMIIKMPKMVHRNISIKKGSFFVDFADDSKKFVTVWEKGLIERCY